MGDHLIASATSVAIAIVGLATIAVLVSRNANTTGVISSTSSGFATALAVAESPVSGQTVGIGNLGFSGFGGITGAGLPMG